MSEQDTRDQFAFDSTDRLIAEGIVLRENRSRAAAIIARDLDKVMGKDEKNEALVDGYSSI